MKRALAATCATDCRVYVLTARGPKAAGTLSGVRADNFITARIASLTMADGLPRGTETRMISGPAYRTVLAVDVEQSSLRPDPVKKKLRFETYRVLEAALRIAGIHACYCDPFVDRGDGALILVRPVDEVPKTLLLNPLLPVLARLLTDYNGGLPAAERNGSMLRLRAVIHCGEVHRDGNGPFGETLDVAFRLLNCSRLKRCLKGIDQPLVVAVSDDIYRSIIRHGYEGISPSTFTPAGWVHTAGHRTRGWVHVPVAISASPQHDDHLAATV